MEKLGFDLDVDQQTPTKNQTSQPSSLPTQPALSPSPRQSFMCPHTQLTSPHTVGLSHHLSSNDAREQRRLSIQRCIDSLVHATHCRTPNCTAFNCPKMKRVIKHTKSCKRKSNSGCPICKQLISLLIYHGKHLCTTTECVVPYCRHIKIKLRERQLQQQFDEAKLMPRRMAVMRSVHRHLRLQRNLRLNRL